METSHNKPDQRDQQIIEEMLRLFRLLSPNEQNRLLGVAEGLNMARKSAPGNPA